MTEFFLFDQLTWPEVEALPRDTPLVIPLGEGYPFERLASALGNPPRAGLLPPVPFGWAGSGLTVAVPLLIRYITNLVDSLRDDRVDELDDRGVLERCLEVLDVALGGIGSDARERLHL